MDINPSRPDAQQTGERPLNLSDFAQQNQITEDRVWELIEEGELAARFVNDEILILREQDAADEPQIDLHDTPSVSIPVSSEITPTVPDLSAASLRPMDSLRMGDIQADVRPNGRNESRSDAAKPRVEERADSRPKSRDRRPDVDPEFRVEGHADIRPAGPLHSHATDMRFEIGLDDERAATQQNRQAMEQDENSLPADDYRDLLVFAQDAMTRTMDLSRQLLATKDELLRMKDERIQQLQLEQQRQEQELRRLRKKVEDLETLCRLTPNP